MKKNIYSCLLEQKHIRSNCNVRCYASEVYLYRMTWMEAQFTNMTKKKYVYNNVPEGRVGSSIT